MAGQPHKFFARDLTNAADIIRPGGNNPCQPYIPAHIEGVFSGKAIAFSGFGQEQQSKLEQLVRSHGGFIVEPSGELPCSHLVAKTRKDAVSQKGVKVVSLHWLDDCISSGELRSVAETSLYRPVVDADGIRGMEGLVICGTGYVGDDRYRLSRLVHAVGAAHSGGMTKGHATHLVCGRLQGAKVAKALEWGIIPVTLQWLEDCLRLWQRLPEDDYYPRGISPCPAEAPLASYESTPIRALRNDSDVGTRHRHEHSAAQNDTWSGVETCAQRIADLDLCTPSSLMMTPASQISRTGDVVAPIVSLGWEGFGPAVAAPSPGGVVRGGLSRALSDAASSVAGIIAATMAETGTAAGAIDTRTPPLDGAGSAVGDPDADPRDQSSLAVCGDVGTVVTSSWPAPEKDVPSTSPTGSAGARSASDGNLEASPSALPADCPSDADADSDPPLKPGTPADVSDDDIFLRCFEGETADGERHGDANSPASATDGVGYLGHAGDAAGPSNGDAGVKGSSPMSTAQVWSHDRDTRRLVGNSSDEEGTSGTGLSRGRGKTKGSENKGGRGRKGVDVAAAPIAHDALETNAIKNCADGYHSDGEAVEPGAARSISRSQREWRLESTIETSSRQETSLTPDGEHEAGGRRSSSSSSMSSASAGHVARAGVAPSPWAVLPLRNLSKAPRGNTVKEWHGLKQLKGVTFADHILLKFPAARDTPAFSLEFQVKEKTKCVMVRGASSHVACGLDASSVSMVHDHCGLPDETRGPGEALPTMDAPIFSCMTPMPAHLKAKLFVAAGSSSPTSGRSSLDGCAQGVDGLPGRLFKGNLLAVLGDQAVDRDTSGANDLTGQNHGSSQADAARTSIGAADREESTFIAEPCGFYQPVKDGGWWMEYIRLYTQEELAVLEEQLGRRIALPSDFDPARELVRAPLERLHCRLRAVVGECRVRRCRASSVAGDAGGSRALLRRRSKEGDLFWRVQVNMETMTVITDMTGKDFVQL
eukprot:jgi/Mesvir1/14749/Mv05392-RA.1